MDNLRLLARSVRPAVEQLDALLVPLSTTFKDSNGVTVRGYDETRVALVDRLQAAKVAIDGALGDLTR